MTISFLHPLYLVLFTLLPLIYFLSHGKSKIQPLLRCLLVTFVILGLMEPVLLTTSESTHHVVIVDQSQSMTNDSKREATRQADEFIKSLPKDDIDIIVIGDEIADLTGNESNIISNSSLSLSQAVYLGLNTIPYAKSGEITLFSDGLATDNHWDSVLAGLQERKVILNWVRYESITPPLAISKLTYSPFILGTEPNLMVSFSTSLENASTYSIRVLLEQNIISETPLKSDESGSLQSELITLPTINQTFSPLTVQLIDNQNAVVDSKPIILAAQSPILILFGSENLDEGEYLQQLLGKSFDVTQIPPPWDTTINLDGYDAIVINDARKSTLPDAVQNKLSNAVDSGTGLLYTGSNYAFSTNGLSNSTLSALLPVNIDGVESKREPGISLAIIIDSSGSMQGQPIALAKQVARLAVRKLKPQDQVGIVEFYGTKQWAVPMQPVQNTEELERSIGRLQAQGGSELFPAIEEAYFGLKSSHNKYRHILLITDAAVEEENYQKLLQYIASDQINVSTVLVGDNASGEEKMADLANWGQGRFYTINNEFSMVELNFRRSDKMPSSSYKEGEFAVRNTHTNNLYPVSINGFSSVPLKPGAAALWTIDNTKEPVLASWQFGAGKVTTLMTEPFGKGTATWRSWQDYGLEIGKQIASLSTFSKKTALKADRNFDSIHVQFDTTLLQTNATLRWKTENDDTWHEDAMYLRAPGIFSYDINAPREQSIFISAGTDNRAIYTALEPNNDLFPEQQVEGEPTKILSHVVTSLGGRLLAPSAIDKIPTSSKLSYIQAISLIHLAFLLALALYFVEIIYRRRPTRRNTSLLGNS